MANKFNRSLFFAALVVCATAAAVLALVIDLAPPDSQLVRLARSIAYIPGAIIVALSFWRYYNRTGYRRRRRF